MVPKKIIKFFITNKRFLSYITKTYKDIIWRSIARPYRSITRRETRILGLNGITRAPKKTIKFFIANKWFLSYITKTYKDVVFYKA